MVFKNISVVAFGDFFSKAIIALLNIALIKILTIDDYAEFTRITLFVFLSYQISCAYIEKKYISSKDNNLFEIIPGVFLAIIAIIFLNIYFSYNNFFQEKIIINFIISFLIIALTFHQILRIIYQKEMRFDFYVALDFLKNILWAIFLGGFFILSIKIDLEITLTTLLVAVFMTHIFILKLKNIKFSFYSHKKNKFGEKDILIFTLVSSVIPYFSMMSANFYGDDFLLASYGVVGRYIALLNMFATIVNIVIFPFMANGGIVKIKNNIYFNIALIFYFATCIALFFIIKLIHGAEYKDIGILFLTMAPIPLVSLLTSFTINEKLINKSHNELRDVFLSVLMFFITGFFIGFVFDDSKYFPGLYCLFLYILAFYLLKLKNK